MQEQGRMVENALTSGRKERGNVVVSWTGGKDGCFACYRAMAEGYTVTHLLSFKNRKRTGSHELSEGIVRAQAEALKIPLIRRSFISYEQEFGHVVSGLRAEGERVDGAVFGHINTHKDLAARICSDLGIRLIMPLWKQDPEKILAEITGAGFEVIIASARDSLMGKEWLGRKIDADFKSDLRALDSSIDPCGENGEFHTLVTDGPIFQKKITITKSGSVLKDGYWHLDIRGFALTEK